jgi:hypothetical protein
VNFSNSFENLFYSENQILQDLFFKTLQRNTIYNERSEFLAIFLNLEKCINLMPSSFDPELSLQIKLITRVLSLTRASSAEPPQTYYSSYFSYEAQFLKTFLLKMEDFLSKNCLCALTSFLGKLEPFLSAEEHLDFGLLKERSTWLCGYLRYHGFPIVTELFEILVILKVL